MLQNRKLDLAWIPELSRIMDFFQHEKLKEKIEGILDIEVIQQQIDNDCLEFEKYAGYILGLMGMLCAPVRDERLAELKEETKVVPLFKGIMDLLEQMKLDMANFTIQQVRPVIVSQSVEYEKLKFREFLDTREGEENGLVSTREWLTRHNPTEEELNDPKYKKLLGQRVLNDSFAELLEWDEYYTLPETLVMDQRRIFALRDKVERVSVSTAVLLLSFSNLNSLIIPMDSQRVKETIKRHIDILLEDFVEDIDLIHILPNVAVQVVKDVNDYLEEKNKDPLSASMVEELTKQINSLEDPSQRIRELLQKRIVDFCKQVISGTMKNMQVRKVSICYMIYSSCNSRFLLGSLSARVNLVTLLAASSGWSTITRAFLASSTIRSSKTIAFSKLRLRYNLNLIPIIHTEFMRASASKKSN